MGQFITGTLERNEAGATYEGINYDRWLYLRVSKDRLLAIFDPIAMTTDLHIGSEYSVLVTEYSPADLEILPRKPAKLTRTHNWYGKVVSTYWRPPEMQYRCATLTYRNHKGVLVNTQHGWMLLHSSDFVQPPDYGNFIQWNQVRLDLLAVL